MNLNAQTRLAVSALTALATFVGTSRAEAERATFIAGGELTAQEEDAVRAGAQAAIEAASWQVVESDLIPAAVATLFACIAGDDDERQCLSEVFAGTKAERAVVVQVASKEDSGKPLRVLTGSVYRGTGTRLAIEQRHCERCGGEQLKASARELVAVLIRQARARAKPTLLALRSVPEGARIILDGRVRGETDMDLWVYPGRHVVRLERDGFERATRELTIDDGEHLTVKVALERKRGAAVGAESGTSAGSRGTRSRRWPWLVVGAGGAALAAGAVLWAVDEDETSGTGLARHRYRDTAPYGLGVGAAGALVVGAGVYLLVRGPEETRPVPIASVDGEAAWVGVRGWF